MRGVGNAAECGKLRGEALRLALKLREALTLFADRVLGGGVSVAKLLGGRRVLLLVGDFVEDHGCHATACALRA